MSGNRLFARVAWWFRRYGVCGGQVEVGVEVGVEIEMELG